MKIDWNYPEPRKGLSGSVDKFIGPGATKAEIALQVVFPFIAVIAAPIYASTLAVDWGVLHYIVCALLAGDMVGGFITNATSTAKRWYHREGQDFLSHFKFIVTHLIHLILVSWLYLSFDLQWVLYAGAYLILAGALIIKSPIYLQRPISLTLYGGTVLLTTYLLEAPLGLEWFLPLFYLKLLVSHLPQEEPYRP